MEGGEVRASGGELLAAWKRAVTSEIHRAGGVKFLLQNCRDKLSPSVARHFEALPAVQTDMQAHGFASAAELVAFQAERGQEVESYLLHKLHMSSGHTTIMLAKFPSVAGFSIEANLKPTVTWIKSLGLSRAQVAKVISTFPSVLGMEPGEGCQGDPNFPFSAWLEH